jgi:ribonucleoside-triphosphate reductase
MIEEEITCTPTESRPQRTSCEVYSRVVGYIRPVEQWNPGKQSEFYDRVMFDSPQ